MKFNILSSTIRDLWLRHKNVLHNRNVSDQRFSVKHFKWNFGGMFLFLAIKYFFFMPNLNILCLIIGFLCIFGEYLLRALNARLLQSHSECHRLSAGGALTQASACGSSRQPQKQQMRNLLILLKITSNVYISQNICAKYGL